MNERRAPSVVAASLEWLANGDTCQASQSLVFWIACGIKKTEITHPKDVPAFRRCLSAIREIGIDGLVGEAAGLSAEWAAITGEWAAIESAFLAEAGEAWVKTDCAPKTHAMIRSAYLPSVD